MISNPKTNGGAADMIRIAISQAAFDAIAATLPLGSVGYEAQRSADGHSSGWRRAQTTASRCCAGRARATAT
jgi:hypothetical protein